MGRIFSRLYDPLMQSQERRFFGAIRQKVVGGATGRVLEVGVGSGLNLQYYREVEQVVGIDPDAVLLDRARHRAADVPYPVTLERGSAEALPYAPQSFDTVVGTLVLCTIPDAERALHEARRVLKPDGRLLLIEHVRADHPVIGRLQDIAAPVWRWFMGGCSPNRQTLATIRRAGFNIVSCQSHDPQNIVIDIEAR